MGFEEKIDASSQVDVTIVGFKGTFGSVQWSWVLTSYLSICCNTDVFLRNHKLCLISGSNSYGF